MVLTLVFAYFRRFSDPLWKEEKREKKEEGSFLEARSVSKRD
jgi:hypothetical protein